MEATPEIESPFDIARNNLQIKHIYLQSSETKAADDLDRGALTRESHTCQYFNVCDRLSYFTTEPSYEGDTLNHWYKFSYSAGVRVLKGEVDDEDFNDDDVLVEVVATFDVFYASEVEVSADATDAYAHRNVQYHVWPFWREYVHSVCGRMGLAPSIEVPSYNISRKV